MRKTPSVLLRDETNRRYVTDEVNPEAVWVLAGEGTPTRKLDGTCVMLDAHGRWWARREVKADRDAPPDFVPVQHDSATRKTVGWEPAPQSGWWAFMREAGALDALERFDPGTYELIGPKVNRNPEGAASHLLIAHSLTAIYGLGDDDRPPFTVQDVKEMVTSAGQAGWEGIVWHHPDGRMAKLKVKDLPPADVALGA